MSNTQTAITPTSAYTASKKKIYLGRKTGETYRASVYLTLPTWDCERYWSFGYLGNAQEHYHLSSYNQKEHHLKLEDGTFKMLTEKRNKCMFDCIREDYTIQEDHPLANDTNLWQFCELALTIYTLKTTAETYNRGGSHMTTNKCQKILTNKQEANRINTELLPALFKAMEELLIPSE